MEYDWIKELAKGENALEERGVFDAFTPLDRNALLNKATLDFLNELKTLFIQAITAFNEFKTSPHGRIKLYGIAQTYADFMLFRNGFKMVFSQKAPGVISIRYNFLVANPLQMSPVTNQNAASPEEHELRAVLSPFGDVQWTFEGQPITKDSVVKYHLTLFIKESIQ